MGRHWLTGSGKRLPLSFTGTIKKAVRILSPAAGDQVATLKAEGLRTKPTSWKRVEWQKETTQNRWIGPRRKPTLPQTFDCHRPIDSFYHLSQSELCFPLLQKWPSILLTSYCSSDALCCRFRNRKAVWSEKILSWHRWYVTASLDFNSFSWGGGKVRQVHLQAYGEGATSQSAKAQMKGCLLCLNETLCMFRGLGLPEPGGAGVLWVPGLLGGHGKVSGNPWHPDTVEEFCICIFSFKWYKVI